MLEYQCKDLFEFYEDVCIFRGIYWYWYTERRRWEKRQKQSKRVLDYYWLNACLYADSKRNGIN